MVSCCGTYTQAVGEVAKAEFMMDGVTPVPDDIVPLVGAGGLVAWARGLGVRAMQAQAVATQSEHFVSTHIHSLNVFR